MPNDDKIAKSIDTYYGAYQKDKNIDIQKLTESLLLQQAPPAHISYAKIISSSILLFPIGGIYYFCKYFFGIGDTDQATTPAVVALTITAAGIIAIVLAYHFFAGPLNSITNMNILNTNMTNMYDINNINSLGY